MMARLNEADRNALRRGGIGVGVILLLILVGFPLFDRWEALNRGVTETSKRIGDISRSVEDAAQAKLLIEKLQHAATVYPTADALNEQTPRLQLQIEALPAYSGLQVSRIEGLSPRDEDGYLRSAVTLQFSGRLGDLQKFLVEVEEASPRLKVERLNLAVDPKDDSRVDGQMVIVGFGVMVSGGKKA